MRNAHLSGSSVLSENAIRVSNCISCAINWSMHLVFTAKITFRSRIWNRMELAFVSFEFVNSICSLVSICLVQVRR